MPKHRGRHRLVVYQSLEKMAGRPEHPEAAALPDSRKPLLVTASQARQLIGVGNTLFWELVKAGKIEMVDIGS